MQKKIHKISILGLTSTQIRAIIILSKERRNANE
nr:MAG TPA: hypothetical protein [Caudoviricetes sp.]